MRIIFLSVLTIIFSSPVFAEQWQCQSAGGWMLDVNGRSIQLPPDPNDTYVIAFSPPNKMQILQSNDPLDAEIYKYLDWIKIGDKFHGNGIYTIGNAVFNVSETMDNTRSVSVATASGHPEIIAAMGINNCSRIQ